MDDIVFAPADRFNQIEHARDFQGVANRVDALLSGKCCIAEIFCQTGQVGHHLRQMGHVWTGWDEDPQMLEKVMLHQGFSCVGRGGWKQLPVGQADVVLGCFAPLSRIHPDDIRDFFQTIHRACKTSGRCILRDGSVDLDRPLHRSYNGEREKWVAMCVPKKEERTVVFEWHWMGAKNEGSVVHSVQRDTRYVHSPEMVKTRAEKAGFSVDLQAGWWLLSV